MTILGSAIRNEVAEILTSSLTGMTMGADADDVSDVFEYEVEPGLYLGVAPRDDDDTIATVYVYIADLAYYTDEDTTLEEHPTITTLLRDIDVAITDAFADTDVDTDAFPDSLDLIDQTGTAGSYYTMDLPREAATA